MKKLLSIVLAITLMLTSTMSTFAAGTDAQASNTITENGFKIETFDMTEKNGLIQKVKVTNTKTGEVEYLETYLVNGKYSYLSISDHAKIRVEPLPNDKENIAKLTNEDTKEVKYLKHKKVTNTNAPTNKDTASPNITASGSSLPFVYQYDRELYGSQASDWTNLTAGVSAIFIICGGLSGIIPALIYNFATAVISNNIETLYYHRIDASARYNGYPYQQYQTWYYYDQGRNYLKYYACFDTYTNNWQIRYPY